VGRTSDIFTPPPREDKDPPVEEPPTQCKFYCFLYTVFNVNLRFTHVYTPPPPNICTYPQFQIPRNNTGQEDRTGLIQFILAYNTIELTKYQNSNDSRLQNGEVQIHISGSRQSRPITTRCNTSRQFVDIHDTIPLTESQDKRSPAAMGPRRRYYNQIYIIYYSQYSVCCNNPYSIIIGVGKSKVII